MASNPGGPNNNGIIINIIANVKQFAVDVKNTLNNAVKQAQTAGAQINAALNKAFTGAGSGNSNALFQKLASNLQASTQQFKQLTSGVNDYLDAINAVNLSRSASKANFELLNNLAAEYGVSLQKAGKIAIQTGELDVESTQATLAANNKLVLSKQELIGTLKILDLNVRRAANGEELLTETVQGANDKLVQQRKVAEQNAGILSFLVNRIKAVVTSLIVAGATYQFFQMLKDLSEQAVEVSQSLFNFQTAVKASQKVLGDNAGSLQEWEETITSLRNELKVFSERDIRNSTTQVINLTKVLNLSKGDIEDIVRVAAALAETTGVDLNQAISDVVHALGGSRVVLDKYGLFIRDADLKTQSLTDGLGGNTAALTSQQLALVTLHEILRQTNPLIQSLTGYEDTLAGQVKTTEASITDSKDNISESLGELNLLFKTLYAEFLEYIAGVTNEFKPLKDFIDGILNDIRKTNDLQAAGIAPPTPLDYGSGAPMYQNPGGDYRGYKYFTSGQSYNEVTGLIGMNGWSVKETEDNQKRYHAALVKWFKDVDDYIAKQEAMAAAQKQLDNDSGGNNSFFNQWYPGATGPQSGLDEDAQKAVDKFNEDIDDLLKDRQRKLDDALTKFNQDWSKSWDDERQALEDIDLKFARDLEDLNTKLKQDIEDAGIRLQRGLADADQDEASKLEEIEKDKNDRLIEIKEDYYDALAQLDREYFFDLFDASANNDAVALKNAERRYNLEKAKLKDKLDDDTTKVTKNTKDNIENVKKETAARKAELEERYRQELEDAQKDYDRKNEQAAIERKREIDDTREHYRQLRAELKEKYAQEKIAIDTEMGRRYNDLLDDLDDQLDAYDDYFDDLQEKWDDYFKELLEKEAKFIEDRKKLYEGGGGNATDPFVCPVGMHWDRSRNMCVLDNTTSIASDIAQGTSTLTQNTETSNVHTVILTSDGTVSDETVEAVAAQLANTIENIVTRKGGAR